MWVVLLSSNLSRQRTWKFCFSLINACVYYNFLCCHRQKFIILIKRTHTQSKTSGKVFFSRCLVRNLPNVPLNIWCDLFLVWYVKFSSLSHQHFTTPAHFIILEVKMKRSLRIAASLKSWKNVESLKLFKKRFSIQLPFFKHFFRRIVIILLEFL